MLGAATIFRQISVLLACACFMTMSVSAQTKRSSDTSSAKRKSASASKRTVSRQTAHTRSTVVGHNQSAVRESTRKVVVTRKMVHGHWVRTSQIVRAPAGPSYQAHPDPERYQQIQQALAQKGYFKGEVNGQWGDDSVEALKRFQTDQKLSNDGKISSLSLIGLGLGPNRETASVKPESAVTADQTSKPE